MVTYYYAAFFTVCFDTRGASVASREEGETLGPELQGGQECEVKQTSNAAESARKGDEDIEMHECDSP